MRALQSLSRGLHPPALRRVLPSPSAPRNPLQTTKKRPYSTNPNPRPNQTPNKTSPTQTSSASGTASPSAATTTTTTRAARILARLPQPLQRYTSRLRGAPVTHVVAFLVLHELTAIVPLLALAGLFHYYAEQLPVGWMVAHCGGYVKEGVGRFERYFRRKGWFGFGEGEGEGGVGGVEAGEAVGVLERWEGDARYRVVVEVGLAYALTKVLLPVRIVGSLWATPWFAGVLGRLRRVVGRGG